MCLKVGQETTANPLDCDAVENAPPCDGDVTGDPHLRLPTEFMACFGIFYSENGT